MTTRQVFILSATFSGATVLRRLLANHFQTDDIGRVFDPSDMPVGKDYFSFLAKRFEQEPEAVFPRKQSQEQHFDDYLQQLASEAGSGCQVIHVSYPQTHIMDHIWQGLSAPPKLLRMIIARSIPVVHVARKDVLLRYALDQHQQLSEMGIGHAPPGLKPKSKRIVLDVGPLVENLTKDVLRVRHFNSCLAGYSKAVGLYCEDIQGDELLHSDIIKRLAGLTGTPATKADIKQIRRQQPSLRELIVNYRQVSDCLRDTPFAEMLDDA